MISGLESRSNTLDAQERSADFLFDVVDEWIGDWWMGGLMVLSVRIGLVKVHWFDRWMVDW